MTAIPVTRRVREPLGPSMARSSPTPTCKARASTRPIAISSTPSASRPSKTWTGFAPVIGRTAATSNRWDPALAPTPAMSATALTSGSACTVAMTSSGTSANPPWPMPRS